MAQDKAARLKAIEKQVEKVSMLPLYAYRQEHGYHAVVGEGSPDARIMFIGEAPGKQEALSGRPFVGRAGRMLDGLLGSIGLERGDVYITNILKDRPPDNRPPQKTEIEQYAPYLRRQIEIIQPRVIVTLGRFAMEFILAEFGLPEQGKKISALHGQALRAKTAFGPVIVVPLFHPAVALYRREQMETLKKDFEALREFVGNKRPSSRK